MAAATVVAILVLVVVMAYLVARALARRRRGGSGGGGSGGGSGGGGGGGAFPYIAPHLPDAMDMFITLQREKMEARRTRDGPHRAVVYRRAEDFARADAVALHYTERIMTGAATRGGMPSMESIWARPGERQIVTRAALPGDPLERAVALQRRLRARTQPVQDSHPALALYVIRQYYKRRRVREYTASVLDAGPGWGGQALAACAACVREYHGLQLVTHAHASRLTDALQAILDTHHPVGQPSCNYWVRGVDFTQHAGLRQYDIVFVSPRDLVPLYAQDALGRALKPGGWVVLILPPGDDHARAGQLALDITSDWPAPASYRLQLPGELHHALVWCKNA